MSTTLRGFRNSLGYLTGGFFLLVSLLLVSNTTYAGTTERISSTTLNGVVTSGNFKGARLASVLISLSPGGRKVYTDKNGRFIFTKLTAGTYRISISKNGYQPYKTSIVVTNKNLTKNFYLPKTKKVAAKNTTYTEARKTNTPYRCTFTQQGFAGEEKYQVDSQGGNFVMTQVITGTDFGSELSKASAYTYLRLNDVGYVWLPGNIVGTFAPYRLNFATIKQALSNEATTTTPSPLLGLHFPSIPNASSCTTIDKTSIVPPTYSFTDRTQEYIEQKQKNVANNSAKTNPLVELNSLLFSIHLPPLNNYQHITYRVLGKTTFPQPSDQSVSFAGNRDNGLELSIIETKKPSDYAPLTDCRSRYEIQLYESNKQEIEKTMNTLPEASKSALQKSLTELTKSWGPQACITESTTKNGRTIYQRSMTTEDGLRMQWHYFWIDDTLISFLLDDNRTYNGRKPYAYTTKEITTFVDSFQKISAAAVANFEQAAN